MKPLVAIALVLLLAGCMSFMSPEQLRASSGMSTCTTAKTLSGSITAVTTDTSDVRKGTAAATKTTIRCGESEMTVETAVTPGQAQPK